MANCIDLKSPEFKKLVKLSGMNQHILSAKVGMWQSQNNTEELPKEDWVEKLGKSFKNDKYRYARDQKSTTTAAMKVKVALSKNFEPLLKLTHTDGKAIESRARLNEMIKDEKWLDTNDHRAMLTMIAVRIPVQGMNSMEFMEVYEFMDPSTGSVIIPPTEIVTKSGADFDVDKMTVMMPSIDLINGKPQLYKTAQSKKSEAVLIAERKENNLALKKVDEKYDTLFKKHDKAGDFKFTEHEKELINNINKEIDRYNERDYNWNTEWRNLSKSKHLTAEEHTRKLEIEERLIQNAIDLQNAYDKKGTYITSFSNDRGAKLMEKKEAERKILLEKKGTIKHELNSYSDKAIQNDLIQNIKSILELSENFEPLITPNSTVILDNVAAEMAPYVTDIDPMDNVTQADSFKTNKGKDTMAGTRALEVMYNLGKHSQNAVGKEALGLGAVDNTYNTLFNRVGAYLNPSTFTEDEFKDLQSKEKLSKDEQAAVDKYMPRELLLSHNTLDIKGKKAISLSSTHDADNNNSIADVVNQMINGWVDVAAGGWIFNIQGNKEVAPTLLFLVQAGVPVEEAVYFVSNPLVREYIKEMQQAKSTFAAPLGKAADNTNAFKFAAKRAILTNPKFGFGLKKVNNLAITKEIQKAVIGRESFTKDELRTAAKSNITEGRLGFRDVTKLDKDVFLHFLQIEELTKSVRDVKMSTNVDTSKDASLFEASNRLEKLKGVANDGNLAEGMIEKLKTNSPISSFFIQDFQISLLGGLFPLRNHKTINSFVKANVDTTLAKKTYGTIENTVINWKSDLINFIFQNELKYLDLDNVKHIHGRKLKRVNVNLNHGAKVDTADNTLYVDLATLNKQYANASFAKPDYYNKLGYAPVEEAAFKNNEEYVSFVLERESIRAITPIGSLQNSKVYQSLIQDLKTKRNPKENESAEAYDKRIAIEAYEIYLKNKALDKTFNHWNMFKSNNSYADRFIQMRATYPALATEFSLLNSLSKQTQRGYRNLKLTNSALDKDQINILHENLKNLTNRSELRAVLPEASETELDEIIELFEMFPTVAFLQSGMNVKSTYALTSFVSQEQMLALIEEPIKKFMTLLNADSELTDKYLERFHEAFIDNNKELSGGNAAKIRGKDYNIGISLISEKGLKRLDYHKSDSINTERSIFVKNEESGNLVDQGAVISFNSNNMDKAKAAELLDKHKDVTFVYNGATENSNRDRQDDTAFHKQDGVNKVGLSTMLGYGPINGKAFTQHMRDLKQANETGGLVNSIDPVNKAAIDLSIDYMKSALDQGQRLALSSAGYGQEMLYKDKAGNAFAPETFSYLSKRLFEEFGYINPNYTNTTEGSIFVQKNQAVTDVAITEEQNDVSDEMVEAMMKNCIK